MLVSGDIVVGEQCFRLVFAGQANHGDVGLMLQHSRDRAKSETLDHEPGGVKAHLSDVGAEPFLKLIFDEQPTATKPIRELEDESSVRNEVAWPNGDDFLTVDGASKFPSHPVNEDL
jgi:hypothetical protein